MMNRINLFKDNTGIWSPTIRDTFTRAGFESLPWRMSWQSVHGVYRALLAHQSTPHEVCVHHLLTALMFLPALAALRARGTRLHLFVHEHEFVLGPAYFAKRAAALQVPLWRALIYSPAAFRAIAPLFTEVSCLSRSQASALRIPRARPWPFLTLSRRFAEEPTTYPARLTLGFCYDPARVDKQYAAFRELLRACPSYEEYRYFEHVVRHEQVPQKYCSAHAFHFPSDAESFSLALCEALAMNRYVLGSRRIGAVEYLELEFGATVLRDHGLYVCDTPAESISAARDVEARVRVGVLPQTRALVLRSRSLRLFREALC